MQLNDMATLTHRLEDVLGLVRDGKLEVTREMIDVMLESLDELKAKVSMHRNDEDYEIQVNKYIAVINSFQSEENIWGTGKEPIRVLQKPQYRVMMRIIKRR